MSVSCLYIKTSNEAKPICKLQLRVNFLSHNLLRRVFAFWRAHERSSKEGAPGSTS